MHWEQMLTECERSINILWGVLRAETSKVSPANLLEGFGVSAVIVPQLSIIHIVDFIMI